MKDNILGNALKGTTLPIKSQLNDLQKDTSLIWDYFISWCIEIHCYIQCSPTLNYVNVCFYALLGI